VPGVPAVLLDHVAEQAAQAGMLAVGPRGMDELVRPAAGQRHREARPGALDSAVPQRVKLPRSISGGGGELPVVAAIGGRIPRRAYRFTAQLGSEGVILHRGQVLEQAPESQLGGTDPGLQAVCGEPVGLVAERCAQAV
jgi:hypothetical protein